MRKKFIWILAIVALIGFVNCVLVEPAFAYQEHAAGSSVNDSHGCMICNTGAHQWIALQPVLPIGVPDFTHAVYLPSINIPIDPSLGSIFHPPTLF
ncbi:MAG TPA: hypothetical protein PKI45_07255 [Candidatus Omnitrophota bacterium]|nr:hypothetical protein [Candidatus Omnitrophota bacterium]